MYGSGESPEQYLNLSTMACNSLLLSLLLIGSLDISYGSVPCKPRQFNHDSVVCVCDESHCDTFDPLRPTEKGTVQIFESTRDGKRFAVREQSFNDGFEPIPGIEWTISVDRNGTYQDIIGFGGAFSDAAALSIASLSAKLQDDILKSYFAEDGIQYSLARVVISGCDFSTRPYSYDDVVGDFQLANFSLVEEDTMYKIPQLLRANELAPKPLKHFASSWSPPAWLKNNGELIHAGTLNGGPGSVYWQTYAKYLVKFFDSYKARGVDFWGMTVQNEASNFDLGFPWNSCGFTPEMERDFVKTDLGPIMEAAGYTPDNFNIMVLDHDRDRVPDHPDVILKDPEAARYLKGTGVHWFQNQKAPVSNYDRLHELHPDKFILATEACSAGPVGDEPALGNWIIGEDYAHDIIRDLTHWVTGWLDWNIALDKLGGPNWVQNYQSAPIHVNPDAGEFYKNPSFYAMGHFSKFLPPGSKRIRTNPEIVDNDKFQTGAFLREDGGIVFVAINSWDENQHLTINDSVLGQVKVNIEPHSFNTFLYY